MFSERQLARLKNKIYSAIYEISPKYSEIFYCNFFGYKDKKKVFVTGGQNNWVLEKDLQYVIKALNNLDLEIIDNPYFADIIHSVWWNKLSNYPLNLFQKKVIIGWISNYIDLGKNSLSEDFTKLKNFINIWLIPSKKQEKILASENIQKYYLPHYVDENFFKRKDSSREEICKRFGIEFEALKDKIIIGSFQRDTQGYDLTSPKPEKGPDILVDILRDLPKDNFTLLIAGPRRHFLIRKCIENKIPYYYIGDENLVLSGKDDYEFNTLNWKEMPLLYNLIDLYLVTSRSEGGPNAILEASWCKTMVFSSNVGIAKDFLQKECIYDGVRDAKNKVISFLKDNKKFVEIIEQNYHSVKEKASFEKYSERIKSIYGDIIIE